MSQQQFQTTEQLDAEQNKAMAIVAYFIFFLPLLAAKDSKFARYHANQGLILLIFCVGLGIINLLNLILGAILDTIGLGILSFLFGLVVTLVYIALGVLGILGIVNAAQGKMQPMPVIGKLFTIIK